MQSQQPYKLLLWVAYLHLHVSVEALKREIEPLEVRFSAQFPRMEIGGKPADELRQLCASVADSASSPQVFTTNDIATAYRISV